MMARFFDYGDGSGASAVEYLLAEEVAAYTEDRKRLPDQTFRPYVLPELIADDPADSQQAAVMNDFEKAACADLEGDQANIL